jgi:hypothetical protein
MMLDAIHGRTDIASSPAEERSVVIPLLLKTLDRRVATDEATKPDELIQGHQPMN